MKKISAQLEKKMHAAGWQREVHFSLIITLSDDSDWKEGVRLVQEAGLQVESEIEEIRAVSGRASTAAIQRIAELSSVSLIESDEMASTQNPASISH